MNGQMDGDVTPYWNIKSLAALIITCYGASVLNPGPILPQPSHNPVLSWPNPGLNLVSLVIFLSNPGPMLAQSWLKPDPVLTQSYPNPASIQFTSLSLYYAYPSLDPSLFTYFSPNLSTSLNLALSLYLTLASSWSNSQPSGSDRCWVEH